MKRIAVWLLMIALLLGTIPAVAEQTVYGLTEVVMEADGETLRAVLEYTADGIIYRCDDPGMQFRQKYSLSGQLLEDADIEDDGSVYSRREYVYDDAGRLISEQSFYADGTTSNLYTYTYNDAGQILSEDSVFSDGHSEKREEYFYNEAGELQRQNSYTNYGMHHYYLYTYDAEGRPVRREEYLAEDGCEYRYGEREERYEGYWTYTYDADGRLLSYVWNHESDDKIWRNLSDYCFYDAAGRLVKYECYGFELSDQVEYVYGADGYLATIVLPMDGCSVQLHYEEMPLPDDVAEAADRWSRTGFAEMWQSGY